MFEKNFYHLTSSACELKAWGKIFVIKIVGLKIQTPLVIESFFFFAALDLFKLWWHYDDKDAFGNDDNDVDNEKQERMWKRICNIFFEKKTKYIFQCLSDDVCKNDIYIQFKRKVNEPN